MKREAGYRAYRLMLIGIILVQAGLSLLYIGLFLADLTGVLGAPVSWRFFEIMQLLTIVGLVLGSILGGILLKNFVRQRREADARLHAAAGEFDALMRERFDEWGLSPSETDIAIFALKGFSNAEIAELRGKSIGTIKAQSNAVFKKAGVNGRTQLIGVLIEDLTAAVDNPA